MDETVINGANLFFADQLGLPQQDGPNAGRNQWLLGLVNAAPYVSARKSYLFILFVLIFSFSLDLLRRFRLLAYRSTE